MIERRSRLRFLDEAANLYGIADQLGAEKFQRDMTGQFDVVCLVDVSHTAHADLGDNAVMREGGVFTESERRRACFSALLAHLDCTECTDWVGPPSRNTRNVIGTRPKIRGSPSLSGRCPWTFSPRRNVPFLLPRSSTVAFWS